MQMPVKFEYPDGMYVTTFTILTLHTSSLLLYNNILLTLILSGCVGGKRCFASRMMLSKAFFNFDFVPKESGSLLTCSIKADKCNSVSCISTYNNSLIPPRQIRILYHQ